MATAGHNGDGWRSQPRDPETGRFLPREYWEPRWDMIKLRVNRRERRMIEEAAKGAGKTMTEWILEACRDHVPRRPAGAPAGVSGHQARLASRLPQNRRRR